MEDAKVQAVREAYNEVHYREVLLEKTLHSNFPPGSKIEWMRGQHIQSGYVVRHGYLTDMIVLNKSTGKTVKIGPYEIIAAAKLKSAEVAA